MMVGNSRGQALLMAARGGSKPDAPVPPPYVNRRYLDIKKEGLTLYHGSYPEFYMHLHSMQIESGKKGIAYVILTCLLCFTPYVFVVVWTQYMMGGHLKPTITESNNAHQLPGLMKHLKANNFEDRKDFLGRRTATFYKNFLGPIDN